MNLFIDNIKIDNSEEEKEEEKFSNSISKQNKFKVISLIEYENLMKFKTKEIKLNFEEIKILKKLIKINGKEEYWIINEKFRFYSLVKGNNINLENNIYGNIIIGFFIGRNLNIKPPLLEKSINGFIEVKLNSIIINKKEKTIKCELNK
jgi:hypothetical protein